MSPFSLVFLLTACNGKSSTKPPTSGDVNGATVTCTSDGCTLGINMTLVDDNGDPAQNGLSKSDFTFSEMQLVPLEDTLDLTVERAEPSDLTYEDASFVGAPILLDESGSMASNDGYEQRLTAADGLIRTLLGGGVEHQLAVMSFPRRQGLGDLEDTDIWQDFTSDADVLSSAVASMSGQEGDGTPLYDSLFETLEYQHANLSGDLTQALVVLTDGADSESSVGPDEVIARAVSQGTTIYVAGLGESLDFSDLQSLATATGGFFAPASEADALTSIFEGLARALYGSVTLEAALDLSAASDTPTLGAYQVTGVVAWKETFSMPIDVEVHIDAVDSSAK